MLFTPRGLSLGSLHLNMYIQRDFFMMLDHSFFEVCFATRLTLNMTNI